MARDYTKYDVEGLGENLNKRQLVFSIVKDWINKNNPSLEILLTTFPDELQGTKGVIRKESEVDDAKRFNMKEPLKIKNGMHVVISNQWGDNIPRFIEVAEKLGYSITKSEEKVSEETLIDLSEFDPFRLNKQFSTYQGDDSTCDKLDEEIERLLDLNPKYNAYALVYEAMGFGYEYYREEIQTYFSIAHEASNLLEVLKHQSLISRILQTHQITIIDVTSENIDFKLLFTSYLCEAINTLINLDDEVLLAEFIFSQSCSEEDEIEPNDNGDWLADLTIDIVNYVYGKDLSSSDYEDGYSFEANHFGGYVDSGYNYPKAMREIINERI
jgi:hypothetical protein